MAEGSNDANGAADQATTPQVRMKVLAQFVRDMSFENMISRNKITNRDVQPDIQVSVNLDVHKRGDDKQYDVISKYKITSKNKKNNEALFILEVEYVGIFHIEGVPDEQLHPFLLIECPRLLFPFVRRIISDITRDGGFPPLNIDTVDFLAIYRQEMQRRAQTPVN